VTERSDGTSVGIVERGGRLVLPLTERSREAERSGRSARLSRVVRLPLNVMICCEGTPERSGKRSRKAEREGVNFSLRAKGQQKKFNSIHQGGQR
jgi:hypothetical protein